MRFSASKIGAILGRFGEKQRNTEYVELWQRHSPSTLRSALQRRRESRDELSAAPSLHTVLTLPSAVTNISVPAPLQSLIAEPCASVEQVAERKVQVRAELDQAMPTLMASLGATASPTLAQAIKAQLVDDCDRALNTRFGTEHENPSVRRFEKLFDKQVLLNQSLHTKFFSEGGDMICLMGRIDGELEDGTVVEIKNRMHRLFHSVRDYEMMQVQTYLEILDRDRAILFETHGEQSDWHEIERDTEWWREKVLKPLLRVQDDLTDLFSDPDRQDTFLSH